MLYQRGIVESQKCQGGQIPRQKRDLPMHDILIAAAFLMMVILPCIVTMGSGATEEDGDDA